MFNPINLTPTGVVGKLLAPLGFVLDRVNEKNYSSGSFQKTDLAPYSFTAPTIHKPSRPLAIAHVIESYSFLRDKARRSDDELSQLIPQKLIKSMKGKRIYVLPGFCNYQPGVDFMRTLGLAAGHGAVLVSMAPKTRVSVDGRFVRLGARKSSYHELWTHEIATVISRMGKDLAKLEKQGLAPNEIVILGHSKGGMLLYGLAILNLLWQESGRLPRKAHDLFPGLAKVPKAHLDAFKKHLRKATLIPVATPLNGLDPKVIAFAQKTKFDVMTKRTSHTYTREFLEDLAQQLGKNFTPEQLMSHAVFAFLPKTGKAYDRALVTTSGRVSGASSFALRESAHVFFSAIGLNHAKDVTHDGLVTLPPKGTFARELHLPANHISIVEDPKVAVQVLEWVG